MTKASDNLFPKILADMNTSAPAAPSDRSWKLYAKANGIFARSSNAEVGPFGAATGLSNPMTTTGDMIYSSDGSGTPARLAIGSNLPMFSNGTLPSWGHPSGSIVQVVRAQSTTDDATTSTTYQASSLSATITPKYSNSIIQIRVDGVVRCYRTAGTISDRWGVLSIQNTTDAVTVAEGTRGNVLVSTSTAAGDAYSPIGLYGEYTVNSTSARTFQLQYKSSNSGNVTVQLRGASETGGIRMVLTEIRA